MSSANDTNLITSLSWPKSTPNLLAVCLVYTDPILWWSSLPDTTTNIIIININVILLHHPLIRCWDIYSIWESSLSLSPSVVAIESTETEKHRAKSINRFPLSANIHYTRRQGGPGGTVGVGGWLLLLLLKRRERHTNMMPSGVNCVQSQQRHMNQRWYSPTTTDIPQWQISPPKFAHPYMGIYQHMCVVSIPSVVVVLVVAIPQLIYTEDTVAVVAG